MTSSAEARPVIVEALRREGHAPTLARVYAVQSLARFDGGYGNYPSPPHGPEGSQSNNWGAVQHPDLPQYRIWRGSANPDRQDPEVKALLSQPAPPSPRPGAWFYASDFYGPPAGQGWFWGPYRVYPDPIEGARHVVRLMARMGAIEAAERTRSWLAVSQALYAGHYFVGYSNDAAKETLAYAKNLNHHAGQIAGLLGEVSPLTLEGSGVAPRPWGLAPWLVVAGVVFWISKGTLWPLSK